MQFKKVISPLPQAPVNRLLFIGIRMKIKMLSRLLIDCPLCCMKIEARVAHRFTLAVRNAVCQRVRCY